MGEMNFKDREELVYETLKREILDLGFKPGQMTNENDICEHSEVSGAPVRDALRLLQEQGFTETIPHRGTYVTLLSLDNIKQMIYMRVAVETVMLRDSLKIQTPMVIEDIRHGIVQQRAVIGEPGFEPKQSYRMDARMHSIWFATVRRQKLWEMLQAQQLHYTRFKMPDFVTETNFIRIIGEHKDLFSMIVDRNEKGLEGALKEHLYYNMKRMHRSIEAGYKDYFREKDEEGRFAI